MRFQPVNHKERLLESNITPMIDIVFLLIIFFLATAQFAKFTRADVDLPKEPGEQEKQATDDGLVINLLADGTIIVAEEAVSIDQLRVVVREAIEQQRTRRAEGTRVLLRADQNARAEALNRVVTTLRELGVGLARLATEPD